MTSLTMNDARRALLKRSPRQLIMPTTTILTLWVILVQSTQVALMMNPFSLETDMKAAWSTLLDVGDGGFQVAKGIIGEMLEDCNGQSSAAWGKECDRALYLEAVLGRAISTATSGGAMDVSEDKEATPHAQDVAVVSDTLPFSTFFLEYAVLRRPVIFPQQPLLTSRPIVESGEEETIAADDGEDMSRVENRGNAGRGNEGDPLAWSSTSPFNSAATTIKASVLFDQEVLDLVADCIPYREGELTGTADGPLRPCEATLLETLAVPRYVAADFVQRFRVGESMPAKDHPEVEQFTSGWQSVHRIRRGSATPVTTCPSGANMLLSVVSGTLEVLVYPSDELRNLRPVYGSAPCAERESGLSNVRSGANDSHDSSTETGVNVDEHARYLLSEDENKNQVSGFVSANTLKSAVTTEEDAWGGWPHEPRFCARVWPAADNDPADGSTENPSRRRNTKEVAAGELLFVPSGGAVSWRAKREVREDEAVVLRFCYVDASNFDFVKTQLPLYAAVEAGASGLLKAFCSPVFDTSMDRNPAEVTAVNYFKGMRSNVNGGGGDDIDWGHSTTDSSFSSSRASSASSVYSSTITTTTTSNGSGRGRRRGKKSFKEWQDDNRWNLKVLSLTLPTLEAPQVVGCGRTNCTVKWISSFAKHGQDETVVGYNLSFVPAYAANASVAGRLGANGSWSGDGGNGGDGGRHMEVYVGGPGLKSEHALDRELLSLGITESKRHSVVVDTNLKSDTAYRFSVGVVYGETAGPMSELSKPARTAKITSSLTLPAAPQGTPGAHSIVLDFRYPHDDGGSPISWYHVMLRPGGRSVLSKWQAVGVAPAPAKRGGANDGRVKLKVEHLVPEVVYQFRICTQNDIGTSPWSMASEPVEVLHAPTGGRWGAGTGAISGFHPNHRHLRLPNVTEASVTYIGEREAPPGEGFDPFERETHGPTVVLDDKAGTVRFVNDTSRSINVWTCHYSPRSFEVTAEVLLADPIQANRELNNGRFVRNRVVVVERGEIPIVHKVLNAQRTGALGVIVADNGRCGKSFDQLCMPGSDPPEGWAALDLPRLWLEVRIPVVLMLESDAAKLRAEAGEIAEEVESMAWTSLYDGWLSSSSDGGLWAATE